MAKRAGGTSLCFVDASGGGLASLAAGVARLLGHADAVAITTAHAVSIPAEVGAVLEEIGASPVDLSKTELPGATRIDLSDWDVSLYAGDGELERLATARIARDRIERRLEALRV